MMTNRDIQRLLTAAGYYNGGIDGDIGDKSRRAIDTILQRHRDMCTEDPKSWPQARQAIAAAQLILHFANHEPGVIDGLAGHNTLNALRSWDYEKAHGRREEVDRTPAPGYATRQSAFPNQRHVDTYYGTPGSVNLTSHLVMYQLPLPMRIDYALDQRSTRVQLHSKCGSSAMRAMEQIVRHYGEKRWRELGLDRNAGTYNHRRMRGGTSWSMHAYACAWDFYAQPNGLTMRCPQALFCRPEYDAFFDIWEANGWTSLGRAIGRDWMHVQAASL